MSWPRRSEAARAPGLLRATAPSWFPPGHLQAMEAELGASCPAPTLVPLTPCHQPTGPGGLPSVPPTDSWAPKFLIIQPESVRRGLAPRTRLPTAQELPADSDRRRVALVPKPRLAAGAKRPLPASSSSPPRKAQGLGGQLPETRAPSGQASMASSTVPPKRLARGPHVQSSQKPVPPEEGGDKVPNVTRQRYLGLFLDQCLKFCPSTREAIEKALKEEKAAYRQSPSKRKYRKLAASTFHRLRGLAPGPGPGPCQTGGRSAVSQDMDLGGKLDTQTCLSLERPDSPRGEDPGKGATLYQRLKEHLLTQAQLQELGYPFPHPERPGGAVLFTNQEKPPQDPSRRRCCRCGTQYLVAPSGRCERQEACHYHWGRLRPAPAAGGWEVQYTCCSAAIGSPGCQVAQQHVRDGRQEDLQGFVRTFAKDLPPGAHPGIYALDCEMCYTTAGLELTRVTVVDSAGSVVFDTFVRPQRDIVDYNTRFSGVTAAHLARTSVSLRDVQAVLLTLFNADTILIGHSLHSDLLALKLIHSTVLDTSVLFPHRLGLPTGAPCAAWRPTTSDASSRTGCMATAPARTPAPACTWSSGRLDKTPRPSAHRRPAFEGHDYGFGVTE
ncbi:hypothetical protein QTO34_001507 [Cnephaeus nilssonii]|uniref:Exonuclease domain-containing protein n=1 Tax=Cnephaeus nilssonii TaxID=3371016 RepID=A0AA40HWT2_CNENI|nr:hypothetical protein QTO34_001507 [Eptesicus nilssonii]